MEELLERKILLTNKYGYVFTVNKPKYVCFDPKEPNGFRLEHESFETLVEQAFVHISSIIFNGLLADALTVEQVSAFFTYP